MLHALLRLVIFVDPQKFATLGALSDPAKQAIQFCDVRIFEDAISVQRLKFLFLIP